MLFTLVTKCIMLEMTRCSENDLFVILLLRLLSINFYNDFLTFMKNRKLRMAKMMTVKLMGFVVNKLWNRRCAKSNFFRFNAGAGKFGAAYAQVFFKLKTTFSKDFWPIFFLLKKFDVIFILLTLSVTEWVRHFRFSETMKSDTVQYSIHSK